MSRTPDGGLRKRRTVNFVQVPSETIRDQQLSFRARGVLAWILDHPDGWVVRSEVIAREGAEGREAIRTALTELAEHGYYRVERRRQPDGQVVTVTAVSDTAVAAWVEEYSADKAAAAARKDGRAGRPRSPVYVQDDTGEWVRADRVAAAACPEPPPAEDGFPGSGPPGSGPPGSGAPGAGLLGSLVQRETQKVTTTSQNPEATTVSEADGELAMVVVKTLPDGVSTAVRADVVVQSCRGLTAAGWSSEQLRRAVAAHSWSGAGPGAVIAWLRSLPAPVSSSPVPDTGERCPNPAHARQPLRGCRGCAADAKAVA